MKSQFLIQEDPSLFSVPVHKDMTIDDMVINYAFELFTGCTYRETLAEENKYKVDEFYKRNELVLQQMQNLLSTDRYLNNYFAYEDAVLGAVEELINKCQ